MKPLFFSSLLCLSACSVQQPDTFVLSQLYLDDDQELGFDFDGDGALDNQLPAWVSAWRSLGFDLQDKFDGFVSSGEFLVALDLYDRRGKDELLFGYRASAAEVPRFDGTDVVAPLDGLFQFNDLQLSGAPEFSEVSATAPRFEWALIPFDLGELIVLPLDNVRLRASLREDSTLQGSLVGTIQAVEIARVLEQMPAALDALQRSEAAAFNNGGDPISCDGEVAVCGPGGFCPDQVSDGVSTGVCVGQDSTTKRVSAFLDEGGDGLYTVDFDEATQRFVRNDLAGLFDLQPGQAPGGLFGELLFDLDLTGDGVIDSFGVAVRFDGVSATQAR